MFTKIQFLGFGAAGYYMYVNNSIYNRHIICNISQVEQFSNYLNKTNLASDLLNILTGL